MYEAWGYAFHRLKLDLKRKRSVYYWWKFRLTIAIRIDLIEFVTQVHYFCWNFFHSNQLIMFHFSLLIVHLLMHIVRLLNAVTMSLFADALIFALLIACIVWFGLTFVKLVKCIPSRMQSDSEAYFCAFSLLPQKMEEFGELFRTEWIDLIVKILRKAVICERSTLFADLSVYVEVMDDSKLSDTIL